MGFGGGGGKRFTARYVNKIKAEIEEAYQAADTSLQVDIDAVDTTVDTILSGSTESLDAFVEVVQAFQTADSENSGSITALAVAAQQDRAAIRTEFADADTTLQTNITAEATLRAAADTTLQANIDEIEVNSGAVAGMNMILAGPNGKKYHFSIDNNGTPSVDEITNVAQVPDTNVILATPGGDRYRFAIDANGTPYVEIVV